MKWDVITIYLWSSVEYVWSYTVFAAISFKDFHSNVDEGLFYVKCACLWNLTVKMAVTSSQRMWWLRNCFETLDLIPLIYIFFKKTTTWIRKHEKVEKYLLYNLYSRPEWLSSTFFDCSYLVVSDLTERTFSSGGGCHAPDAPPPPLHMRLPGPFNL